MMERACWAVAIVCLAAAVAIDHPRFDARTKEDHAHKVTCQQLCAGLNIKDGCQRPPKEPVREEVIMITDGSPSINLWKWDTITMVVTTYFDGISKTSLTSCIAHSKGKRYGLREPMPAIDEILKDKETTKKEFIRKVTDYQMMLMADHMVFDLLDFFHQLDAQDVESRTTAVEAMGDVLSAAATKVRDNYDSEVFCVVPWEPPCPETNCTTIKMLLGNCNVLLLSPDSYMPVADEKGMCTAQATVPVSKFLYGVDRYLALGAQPNVLQSIVAGIPWHGYTYMCNSLSGDTCTVQKTAGERCFDNTNRRRQSLSEIHSLSVSKVRVKMEEVTKGIYYNVNESAQTWFENFTTLYIKYQLVQDLQLRGLSIWSGEDLTADGSTSDVKFFLGSWDFLTHHVLHKAVYHPVSSKHVYADTVAGVGVGCLLLGTALGVLFTCIALRRNSFRRMNRPFKLDEVDDGFRDDEGL